MPRALKFRTAEPAPSTPATQVPPAPLPDEPADATVMMSPDMGAGGLPPAAEAPSAPALAAPPETPGPSAPPAPNAPPEGAGFQENFAVEAGERELSVDSDDRTMFLGKNLAAVPPTISGTKSEAHRANRLLRIQRFSRRRELPRLRRLRLLRLLRLLRMRKARRS